MDIDVKNALDKVQIVCNSIEVKTGMTMSRWLAGDIYHFIDSIFKDGTDDRFDYFSKIYLKGKYSTSDFANEQPQVGYKTISELCAVDSALSPGSAKNARLLIAFFTVLGRYYTASPMDRKDISLVYLTKQLKELSAQTNDLEKTEEQTPAVLKESPEAVPQNVRQPYENNGEPAEEQPAEPEETLEELLEKLNSLIGLAGVKKEVNQIINLIKVQKKGEEFGEKLPPLSLHLVFYGNPGTGKTTVARLLAKIYQRLGVLSTGQLIEVDRGGLVAGYVGQTATKTQEVIDKAMGGILFIDEAYALTHGKGDTDFGQEAIDTLLKAMEDHRDNFIVIVAGYPDLMKEFIASNPGLKSRFNQYISFEDYTPDELLAIFHLYCSGQNLRLAGNCDEFLADFFKQLYENRNSDYANGRDVRNYFEKVILARANRLAENLESISREEYLTITASDLKEASGNIESF